MAFYAFLADGRRGVYRADPIDLAPPTITPPSPITIAATEPSGATGNASAAIAAFLAAGTAVDNVDPSPVRLVPQFNGADTTNTTLFPIGSSTVTFRFQDAAGNIGNADSTIAVTAPPSTCATNVTGSVAISVGSARYNKRTQQFTQRVTLRKGTAGNIQGPLSFVLDGLTPGVALVGAAGPRRVPRHSGALTST